MQFSNRQIFLIIAIVAGLGATIFLLYSSLKTGPSRGLDDLQSKKTVRLLVWGVDDSRAFATIKKNFESLRKEVAVSYVQVDPETIQERLVNALALNQGPDVVMIKNRTLGKQKSLLVPAPSSKFSITSLKSLFPTVVEQDFADRSGQVYALPLSVDTLALVYNKDFFDQARIANPPQTWTELSDIIPQLVQTSPGGQINRAAIAIGGSGKSITNVGDVMPLLFMQSGFSLSDGNIGAQDSGGRKVLDFYLQFSNPRSLAYTWNELQENDLQSFADLKSAMVLAYKRQLAAITNQNTFLNYGVASMPQLGKSRVDYADYWGLAVLRSSRQQSTAWDFVTYAATVPQNAQSYQQATGYPPALRSLIQSNLNNPQLGVFSQQAFTARSWASSDDTETRKVFSDMISSYLTGQADQETALGRAQNLLTGFILRK